MSTSAIWDPKTAKSPFDVERAKAILQPADFYQNPSMPFCQFTLINPLNETKLILGVQHSPRETGIHLDLVTIDCPPLGSGQGKRYQHLVSLGVHKVEAIEYHPELDHVGFIEFKLHALKGTNSRWIRVFRGGYFCGNIH